MSREASTSDEGRISSVSGLLDIFLNGARPYSQHRIGLETEKLGVHGDSHAAISYSGENGVEVVLKALGQKSGWNEIKDEGHVIALEKDGAAITLEPGGQLELSGGIHASVLEVDAELKEHLKLLCSVSKPLGIKWLGVGIHPFSGLSDIEWVPKSRYKIMRKYYEDREPLAHHMMKMTAATQVNLDYSDENDARMKIYVGCVAGTFISAMLANSSIERGAASGYCSKRIKIWQHTDRDRCGIPEFFMDGSFSFEKYRDFALNIPMYFIYRDGKYIDKTQQTFQTYFEKEGDIPSGDWVSHLTTLFPDVRLKNHLEYRTMDATPAKYALAATAFWVGLFASPQNTEAAYELSKSFSREQCLALQNEIAVQGMAVTFNKMPISHFCRQFLELASLGLAQRSQNEAGYLDPLKRIVESGRSLGEEIAERWPNSFLDLCAES